MRTQALPDHAEAGGLDDGFDLALVSPRVARAITGGISASTQARLVKAGDYPAPVVLSRDRHGRPARVSYVRGELRAWCRRRIADARGGAK